MYLDNLVNFNGVISNKKNMRKNRNNILYTENQSMLVSDRKHNIENFNTNPSENQNKCACSCEKKIALIETRLEMLALSIDQMTSHINISYTKHMEGNSKLMDEKKQRENLEHIVWQLKQQNKSYFQKYSQQAIKSQQEVKKLTEEVENWAKMLRQIRNWKNSQSQWFKELQKEFEDIADRSRKETDEKLKKMFNAIEEIGILQRKMLNKSDNRPDRTRGLSSKQRYSVGRKNSIWNESTLIASRNRGYC